jgi:hypothetical protein
MTTEVGKKRQIISVPLMDRLKSLQIKDRQLYRTIRGQIKAGDFEGAARGMDRIERRQK